MPGAQRIGVWFAPGVEHALAARAFLGELQAEYPGANLVLLGPRESLFLFEMDARVSVYIPLRAMAPRRAAQSRLSYFLEKRSQFKKLRGLQLDECVGVSVMSRNPGTSGEAEKQFRFTQNMLAVGGRWIQQEFDAFMAYERPLLQVGPQSLVFATQYHRQSNPNEFKLLVVLNALEAASDLDQQWQAAQASVALKQPASLVVAVISNGDRLLARRLAQTHPDWLQVDFAQAMGLIVYADRVISSAPVVTRICQEMGHADWVLLGKSNN